MICAGNAKRKLVLSTTVCGNVSFWTQILSILINWFGAEIPLSSELCLLGDKSHLPNITKCNFSVISVGTTTACRVILRHRKASEIPQVKEWVCAMNETASYECMLSRLSDDREEGVTSWDRFWNYIKVNYDPH